MRPCGRQLLRQWTTRLTRCFPGASPRYRRCSCSTASVNSNWSGTSFAGYERGPDAAQAVAHLGRIAAAVAGTDLLVTWEEAGLDGPSQQPRRSRFSKPRSITTLTLVPFYRRTVGREPRRTAQRQGHPGPTDRYIRGRSAAIVGPHSVAPVAYLPGHLRLGLFTTGRGRCCPIGLRHRVVHSERMIASDCDSAYPRCSCVKNDGFWNTRVRHQRWFSPRTGRGPTSASRWLDRANPNMRIRRLAVVLTSSSCSVTPLIDGTTIEST